MELFIDYVKHQEIRLAILVSHKGLVYVGDFSGQVESEILARICQGQACHLSQNKWLTKPYVEALKAYFEGNLKTFKLDLDFTYGTAFQQEVWLQLVKIPYGETRTYGQIAQAIGRPKAYRAVGRAIGLNPIAIVVPCHRVLNQQGGLHGYRGGLTMKEYLLNLERLIRKG